MTALHTPFHVVYTNMKWGEEVDVCASERSAALKLLERMSVGVNPLVGITEQTWLDVQDVYEQDGWKGASIFRIEQIDPEVEIRAIDAPLFSPDKLNMAELTSHLSGNPESKAVIFLMNQDYIETARVFPDRASAVKGLILEFGLTTCDVRDPDDFGQAFSEKYELGSWKGLLIVEVDLVTLKAEILDPEQLEYDMADLVQPEESLRP